MNLLPERLLGVRIITKEHPIVHTTIIKADNVLKYWYDNNQDVPIQNVAPIFDNLFIQFRYYDEYPECKNYQDVGIHLVSTEVNHETVRWITRAALWFPPGLSPFNPFMTWVIDIDRIGNPINVISEFTSAEIEQRYEEYRDFCGFFANWIQLVFVVLNLMHCKNVNIEKQPLSNREKRMEEKHNKPTMRYHLLKVRSVSDGLLSTNGQLRGDYAAHICRGHFKTFTDEAPLLGKFVGTYWWDAHVRGRDKTHVVDKDYELETFVTSRPTRIHA